MKFRLDFKSNITFLLNVRTECPSNWLVFKLCRRNRGFGLSGSRIATVRGGSRRERVAKDRGSTISTF